MSTIKPITVNVQGYLSVNKFEVDEEHAHVELAPEPDREEFLKLVRVCPAGLYRIDDEGNTVFDYAGCLECGTCRITAGDTIVERWEYPSATMGVEYRYG